VAPASTWKQGPRAALFLPCHVAQLTGVNIETWGAMYLPPKVYMHLMNTA
jgi:hypothetical protein